MHEDQWFRRTFLLLVFVGSLITAPGCESGGGGSSGSTGSSLSDLLEAERARKRAAGTGTSLDAGASSLPAGWKQDFDRTWALFLRNDPQWPEAQQAWTARGPEARLILVENLIRAHVLGRDHSDAHLFYRSRAELVTHSDVAVPYLVVGLGEGGSDSVVRNLLADLLASFGDQAIPEIEKGYDDAANERGRQALARSLKVMKSNAAVPLMCRIATDDSEYMVRLEAIEGLGKTGDPRAAPALRQCLGDSDPSVRKFAAGYLSGVATGDRAAMEDLVRCYETSLRDSDLETARAARRSLAILLGRDFGTNPAAWRAAIARGEGR